MNEAREAVMTMMPLEPPVTLASLKHHWGSGYIIRQLAEESWTAVRRDGKGAIRADSAHSLLVAIRLDYATAPVPRQPGQEDES